MTRSDAPSSSMPNRILIVDDDRDLSVMLAEFLRHEGFDVAHVEDGTAALAILETRQFDLLILDIMLPGLNGLELLRGLRQSTTYLPVMMLTARGDADDRIAGLELGADDYLPKPFDPRELLARIRAILRRGAGGTSGSTTAKAEEIVRLGNLILDLRRRRASIDDRPLELTSAEFRILNCLLDSQGKPVDRHALTEQALGRQLTLYDRAIDTHVSNLRRKMERVGTSGVEIRAVRGTGYELIETR